MVVIYESDEGYTVDSENNCYNCNGEFLTNLCYGSIKAIASGEKFGGMFWHPVNFSLENE